MWLSASSGGAGFIRVFPSEECRGADRDALFLGPVSLVIYIGSVGSTFILACVSSTVSLLGLLERLIYSLSEVNVMISRFPFILLADPPASGGGG